MIAILADRDLTLVIGANRFDYPHQAIRDGPIDLRQVPPAKVLVRFRMDRGWRSGSEALGFVQKVRLILFQSEGPV